MARPTIISLCGFMGCGKTTVGELLNKKISGSAFYDLDVEICTRTGRTIPEIFASEGEKGFRETESRILRKVLDGIYCPDSPSECPLPKIRTNHILALGGGTLTIPENRELIRKNTFCIYLKAGEDTLVSNLIERAAGRPMLNGISDRERLRMRVRKLMEERSSVYEKAAWRTIITDGKDWERITDNIIKSVWL